GRALCSPRRPVHRRWHGRPTLRPTPARATPEMDSPLLARRTAEGLAGRLQRHNALLLVAFLAVYFLLTARIAAHKSYWYDELYTLYISRAATPGEVWRELAAGADLNPPLCHLLTWASLR